MAGEIHDEHPFATPSELRDPIRQFRGRLTGAVTVVTAGAGSQTAGLTVSSLMVAEGEPARVYLLVGPTTDLYDAMEASGRFVVHVLSARDRELSDVFAGIRPAPGGPFAGLEVEDTPWGPVIAGIETRAYCTFAGGVEETYSVIVTGDVDRIEVGELDDPLVYFRGAYRSLGPA